MSDINISVDSSQVIGGKKAVDDFGVSFAKLVAKLNREQRLLEQALKSPWEVQSRAIEETSAKLLQASTIASRENQKIVNANLGVTNSYKSAKESAEAFVEALKKQELIQTQNRAETGFALGAQRAREEAAALDELNRSKAQAYAREDQLRQKYDQGYAALRIYKVQVEELNEALSIGAISPTRYGAAIDKLNSDMTQGVGAFSRYSEEAARNANQFGVVIQQTGYQVGDFLVQVQSGTNWMVAFGQQATQLVGTLPLLANILGVSAGRLTAISTGLGIAIPLVTAIGAAWLKSSEDADSTSKSVKTLDDRLKALDATLEQWATTKRAAEAGLTVEQLVGSQGIDRALADMEAAEKAYNKLLEKIQNQPFAGGGMGPGAAGVDALIKFFSLRGLEKDLAAAEKAYSEAVEKVGQIQSKIAQERITSFKREEILLKEIQDIELDTLRFGKESEQVKDRIAAKERRIYQEGLNNKTLNSTMVGLLMEQYDQGVRVAKQAELWNTIVQSVKDKLSSIDDMQLDVRLKIVALWDSVPDYIKDYIAGASPLAPKTSPRPTPAPPLVDEMGGGKKGKGDKDRQGKLESLVEELQTERETLEIWYEKSQLLLSEANAKELELIGGQKEAKLRLEEEYQARLRDILGQEKNTRLTETANMFDALADIASVGGKKMAKATATFQAIEGIVNAYGAAIKALNTPGIGIAGRFAAYASVLAAGLKGVAAIRSAGGIGGGSSGGGGASGGPSSAVVNQAESLQPQTVYIDSIDPNNLYTGDTLIRLFEAFYSENDKRGKVFVVRS